MFKQLIFKNNQAKVYSNLTASSGSGGPFKLQIVQNWEMYILNMQGNYHLPYAFYLNTSNQTWAKMGCWSHLLLYLSMYILILSQYQGMSPSHMQVNFSVLQPQISQNQFPAPIEIQFDVFMNIPLALPKFPNTFLPDHTRTEQLQNVQEEQTLDVIISQQIN